MARVATLLGDPARAAIVSALIDGRALPAGELARMAGIKPQTASEHLSRMVDGKILAVRGQGRHRYFFIAHPDVAAAVEQLGALAEPVPVRSLRASLRAQRLSRARCCYDHLAGRIAVRIVDALRSRDGVHDCDGGVAVTETGAAIFAQLEIDVDAICGPQRVTRTCPDWTQRLPHLSGVLGRALLAALFARGAVERTEYPRELRITESGSALLRDIFGISVD
jgi:DNA-binding transcriptional ArsR family regulator